MAGSGRRPSTGRSTPTSSGPHPLATEQVLAVVDAVPAGYRALTVMAAATGLRQGEAFGVTIDHLDFLRRSVRVEQQMKYLPPRTPFLARPKTTASLRTVPLPDVALEAAAEHLRRSPATTAVPALSGRHAPLVFPDGTGRPFART